MFCMLQGLCSYYSYHLDIAFYFIGWEAGYTHEKNEVRPYFIAYTKFNSTWIQDLNVRPQILKLLAENLGNNLDIDLGNEFFGCNTKSIGHNN